jgi:hypothetical protein
MGDENRLVDTRVQRIILEEWNELYMHLPSLNEIHVDRKIVHSNQLLTTELRGFSDVSEAAYRACIYLKHISIDHTVSVSLVTSKSRVSPLKQQSLPRLELCGAVLLARLIKKVIEVLQLNKILVDEVFM